MSVHMSSSERFVSEIICALLEQKLLQYTSIEKKLTMLRKWRLDESSVRAEWYQKTTSCRSMLY